MKKVFFILLAALAASFSAQGQFTVSGSDAGKLRWNHIETSRYDIIYPKGADSLARAYARILEQVCEPVGQSAGFVPNQMSRKKLPVVLHTQTAYANGMVTWAPSRMDLMTIPDPYRPEPFPSARLLGLHESRHVAQMQLGLAPCYKGWNIVFGEIVPGFIAGIYPGRSFLEGDAVLAETALTPSGRGRSADFLEYYRISTNEKRSFRQWRYGSIRRYTPDYYATSYIAMAGIRDFYGVPDFTEKYFHRILKHHGWAFGNIYKTLREEAGTTLEGSFRHTLDTLARIWAAEDAARGPFMEGSRISPEPKYYKSWSKTSPDGNGLLAVRSGLTESATLVRIGPDGSERKLRPFASTTSQIRHSSVTGLDYWSEYRADIRWEMRSWSEICCTDTSGRFRTLTRHARLFNPAPSDTEAIISACLFPENGGSALVIMDALDGHILRRINLPEGMQAAESAWAGGQLYFSAVTEDGLGIWSVGKADSIRCVLEPRRVHIKQMDSYRGEITFVCDRTGVNELYGLDPSSGNLRQLTCTRAGASDFAFLDGQLYYSVPGTGSRGICWMPVDSLPSAPADWSQVHKFAMADEVSAAEPMQIDWDAPVEVSDSHRYSKGGHLFRFHSWAPLYINYDAIESMSLSSVNTVAGLGATAFFQNSLSTCYGFAGIKLFEDNWSFKPSFHAKFTYTGWYPVIEAGVDFGGRKARQTTYTINPDGKGYSRKSEIDEPFFFGNLKTYIPFRFNSGGWSRGLIPQVSASIYNDGFRFSIPASRTGNDVIIYTRGEGRPLGRVSASLRGYSMKSTPQSCIYPKLGIGAEVGYNQNLCKYYRPTLYAYLYGYLPGIGQTNGIRLTATVAGCMNNGGYFVDAYANTLPRGFSSALLSNVAGYPVQTKLTLDYAIPFASFDWGGLCPIAYLRNLELIPHFDWSYYRSSKTPGDLFSAGASIALVLNEFVRIPGLTRIGLDFSYNGGALYDSLGSTAQRTNFSMVFSVSL